VTLKLMWSLPSDFTSWKKSKWWELQPWNTIVSRGDPGQMRSPTWNYINKHRSAFYSSVASFFVWLVNRCACGHTRSFRFCIGSKFKSRWPDVMVSVRWLSHAEPTWWLEGAERQVAVKSWNSLSTCFYSLVSSIQKKLFTSIIFFYE